MFYSVCCYLIVYYDFKYDMIYLCYTHHTEYYIMHLLMFKHRWLEVMEGGTSWNVGECQRRSRLG